MNGKHANDYVHCTKAETMERLQKGGTVLTDAPPMTAEQLITGGLITHIDQHFGGIRETVGH